MTSPAIPSNPFFTALVNHLWQTTIVLAIVWGLSFVLRAHRAEVRFGLWLLAAMKFLLPFSLLVTAGQSLRPHAQEMPHVARVSPLVTQVVQPYHHPILQPTLPVPEPSPYAVANRKFCRIYLALWAVGACGVAFTWLGSWKRLRLVALHATPWMVIRGVPVRLTRDLLEPGVFGMVRPVMLMPEELSERMTAAELNAVFAHELCHVRRRDNLWAALHQVVLAVFWFHPGVWLIRNRLLLERERACDEAVVRDGEDAELYALTLLNVCRFCVETPSMAMAGVTGGELKDRLVRIMRQSSPARLGLLPKLLLGLAALLIVSLPVLDGLIGARNVHAQEQSAKSFDAVSIHPAGDERGMSMRVDPMSWETKGAPLRVLVWAAFGLKDFQIRNAPGWIASERYTIRARFPEDLSKLSSEESSSQLRAMEQSMLVERFHLRYHWVTQVLPVYSLMPDKGGARVPVAKPDEAYAMTVWPNAYAGTAMTMANFADNLGSNMDRIVLDRTGLSGKYTFKLTYAPDPDENPTTASSPEDSEARLLAALRDQLGLKLVAEKQPIQVLVIDNIERPTPN